MGSSLSCQPHKGDVRLNAKTKPCPYIFEMKLTSSIRPLKTGKVKLATNVVC
ncbi:MAG: hypothetical protein ACJAYG_000672 [Oceanicoccus sp.]|jgi:hypothetical protein